MKLVWCYHIGSCKLVALELHISYSCKVVIKLDELHMYTISHLVSCIHCNSCNLSNNIHIRRNTLNCNELQITPFSHSAHLAIAFQPIPLMSINAPLSMVVVEPHGNFSNGCQPNCWTPIETKSLLFTWAKISIKFKHRWNHKWTPKGRSKWKWIWRLWLKWYHMIHLTWEFTK